MNFYAQQGYLNIVDATYKTITLKIPNEKIKRVFLVAMFEYFELNLGIERNLLKSCIDYFKELNIENNSACHQTLSCIRDILEIMCNEGIHQHHQFMNEAIFQHLVFTVLYATGFQPATEIRFNKDDRKYKQYDMCAVSRRRGIVIEFEQRASVEIALKKILDKEYFKAIEQRSEFSNGNVKNVLLLGINVKTRKSDCENENCVTICYLRDSINIENNIKII